MNYGSMAGMKKSEAIKRLGGSVSSAAKAIGISYQAVRKWPDQLSQRVSDRVIAAEARGVSSAPQESTHV